MTTIKRTYPSTETANPEVRAKFADRPKVATVERDGTRTVRVGEAGTPTDEPTYCVKLDGKLHLSGVTYDTALFDARVATGTFEH